MVWCISLGRAVKTLLPALHPLRCGGLDRRLPTARGRSILLLLLLILLLLLWATTGSLPPEIPVEIFAAP
jgi:hypothetical protein